MLFLLGLLVTVALFFLNSAINMAVANIAHRFVDAIPAFGYVDSMWITGGLMLLGIVIRTAIK